MSSYAHINGLTAGTALSTHSVQLKRVVINTKGAAANLLTLYDSASTTANVIAVIDTTTAIGDIMYDINTLNGLYAVLAAGTAADLTIDWE